MISDSIDAERMLVELAGREILANTDRRILTNLLGLVFEMPELPEEESDWQKAERLADEEIKDTPCPFCETVGHLQFSSRCAGHGESEIYIECSKTGIHFPGDCDKTLALQKLRRLL